MSDLWEEFEDEKAKRGIDGKFKKGVSGNPNGRPSDNLEEGIVLAPKTVKAIEAGTKRGPKKKTIQFDLDENFIDAADSVAKNGKQFMLGVWKQIQAGDERLSIEMLKIVTNKMGASNPLAGLKDFENVDLSLLQEIANDLNDD